jgi:lysophospholipase L1-like esterase
MRRHLSLLATSLLTALASTPAGAAAQTDHWIASWTASPQPVWDESFIFPTNMPVILKDQSIIQNTRISLGGDSFRLVLGNEYGKTPIVIGQASVTLKQNQETAVLQPTAVTFHGLASARIAAGARLISDPIALPIPDLSQVTVSLYLPDETPVQTFHWDARQTSWIVDGNQTGSMDTPSQLKGALGSTARIILSGIEVKTNQQASTVAVLGDSITDGATASLDTNSRWPDFLAQRLIRENQAVINAGISGARLLLDGMGENALARLEQDVLSQPGVKTLIVLIGINDIAWPGTVFAPDSPLPSLDQLTDGYQQLVRLAKRQGIRVLVATLPPFRGALPDTPLDNYYQPEKDQRRIALNHWLRTSDIFDGVIDMAAILEDPHNRGYLNPLYDSGDHLHPGDPGNQAMAEGISLLLLKPSTAQHRSATLKQTDRGE